jgi:hypothetical protein
MLEIFVPPLEHRFDRKVRTPLEFFLQITVAATASDGALSESHTHNAINAPEILMRPPAWPIVLKMSWFIQGKPKRCPLPPKRLSGSLPIGQPT